MKTWIVVANRSEAKIFTYNNREVEFVFKLENPRGRLKSGDINADRAGFFTAGGTMHGSDRSSQQSPTERVAQEFAKTLSDNLEESRIKADFEEMVLIADPHFLGLLRNTLSKDLRRLVSREIPKDLGAVTSEQIQERLWPEEPSTASL